MNRNVLIPLNEQLTLIEFPLYSMPNNVFLIKESEGEEYIIVDTGQKSDYEKLWKAVKGLKIKYIIITHAHFDHCGGASRMKKAIIEEFEGAVEPRIIVHEYENRFVSNGEECEYHGSSKMLRMLKGVMKIFEKKVKFEKFSGDYVFPSLPREVELDLKNHFNVELIELRGHSKGMLGVIIEVEDTVIFLGADLLFPENMGLFGQNLSFPLVMEGSVDSHQNSRKLLNESIFKVIDLKPDEIYFSHIPHVESLKGDGGFKISFIRFGEIEKFMTEKGIHRQKEENVNEKEATDEEKEEEVEGEDENEEEGEKSKEED